MLLTAFDAGALAEDNKQELYFLRRRCARRVGKREREREGEQQRQDSKLLLYSAWLWYQFTNGKDDNNLKSSDLTLETGWENRSSAKCLVYKDGVGGRERGRVRETGAHDNTPTIQRAVRPASVCVYFDRCWWVPSTRGCRAANCLSSSVLRSAALGRLQSAAQHQRRHPRRCMISSSAAFCNRVASLGASEASHPRFRLTGA